MRVAIGLALCGALVMACIIGYGFAASGGWAEVGQIVSLPWGIATMVDIYVGFFLFCAWIWYREQHAIVSVVFTLLVLTLGNLFTCLYVLMALLKAKGNWHVFWLGDAANKTEPITT